MSVIFGGFSGAILFYLQVLQELNFGRLQIHFVYFATLIDLFYTIIPVSQGRRAEYRFTK